jgi:hypothetical protein
MSRLVAAGICATSFFGASLALAQPAPAPAPTPAPVPAPAPAPASEPTEPNDGARCIDAFGAAQRLRREGKLRASRAELEACGAATCPTALSSKCVEWLGEVRASIPTVVLAVRDARGGRDWPDAVLSIDGVRAPEALGGRAVELDPGPHVVRAEVDGKSVEESFVTTQGERGRPIELVIPRPVVSASPPPPLAPRRTDEDSSAAISPLVFVGFGVAVLGTAVGIGTGVAALLGSASSLEEQCGGTRCADTEANRDEHDGGVVLANVSTASFVVAGIGAALGGVGIALTVTSSDRTSAYVSPTSAGLRGRF